MKELSYYLFWDVFVRSIRSIVSTDLRKVLDIAVTKIDELKTSNNIDNILEVKNTISRFMKDETERLVTEVICSNDPCAIARLRTNINRWKHLDDTYTPHQHSGFLTIIEKGDKRNGLDTERQNQLIKSYLKGTTNHRNLVEFAIETNSTVILECIRDKLDLCAKYKTAKGLGLLEIVKGNKI